MAKIVVTFNGLVQQELTITKSRLTIGRRPSNDVVIDHLTVSGQHAAIDTSSNGSFVLDLGSTNGTMVNGQPVKKHLLQHDDIIDIGKYKLRFQVEKDTQGKVTQSVSPTAQVAAGVAASVAAPAAANMPAKVKVLTGANAGKELVLSKPVTTIGSPSVQVVAITRQDKNYFIAHVEGTTKPKLNDVVIESKPVQLKNNDVIELNSAKLQFMG
ncbi:FHA domain-containing protein [Undibacterium sp. CY18W]|uniref:FHA domain-containing protein n=1 Tax=Undibacterium hunanense TaxID=2762292 RepID=A0ABR6ZR46_9BURK|nr:FHA domain-containing protein [Undibacterium hunanense]MBC3917985.1 FHA domain-containing protein [Undibacterium hunanense]